MKNKNFLELALLGLASGLMMSSASTEQSGSANTSPAAEKSTAIDKSDKVNKDNDMQDDDPNKGNLGYHLMTDDELLLELNDDTTKLYNTLTAEGKALARFVASQRCNGSNECKGLNACETETNKCAGQGGCRGKSKCAFADKNLAVKVVAKKMAEKRANLNNSGKNSL